LIDNEDGTMSVVLPKQVAHRRRSVINSSASLSIVKREFEDATAIAVKELSSSPKVSSARIRSISASKVVPPTAKVIDKPIASESDSPGEEDDTLVAEVQPLASVTPADPEPKNKGRKLINSSNGTQPDCPKDLYFHGAETIMDSWEIKPGLIRASRRLGGEGFEVEQSKKCPTFPFLLADY
jgi:hypothetical protein